MREKLRQLITRHSLENHYYPSSDNVIADLADAILTLFEQELPDREYCHNTYNGGYRQKSECDAFHHGMDTVFNMLDDICLAEIKRRPKEEQSEVICPSVEAKGMPEVEQCGDDNESRVNRLIYCVKDLQERIARLESIVKMEEGK